LENKTFNKILEAPPEEIERELNKLQEELDTEIPQKSKQKKDTKKNLHVLASRN
jgi:F0F1-type ATP synthase membrane subunit b/b'